jgi:RNA polymerase sigma factor (sigma-70 family)
MPVVHVVDDDEELCRSLVFLLDSVGIRSVAHPDATSFLANVDLSKPAVLIVDIRMPGMSGLQLQERLRLLDYPAPIIFCSAHGDIPMSVRALRYGAVDFLQKPYEPQEMLEIVQLQIEEAHGLFRRQRERNRIRAQLDLLTPREREVLQLVVQGTSSQLVARQLGTSVRTIDVHRARIKAKTESESLGTLVHDILHHGLEV